MRIHNGNIRPTKKASERSQAVGQPPGLLRSSSRHDRLAATRSRLARLLVFPGDETLKGAACTCLNADVVGEPCSM